MQPKEIFDDLDDDDGVNHKLNVMDLFRLDEISAVDQPAQAGARMAIIKRGNGATTVKTKTASGRTHFIDVDDDDQLVRSLQISNNQDQERAVADFNVAVADIENRDNVDRFVALQKAARENPALLEGYRRGPDVETVRKAAVGETRGRSLDVQRFDLIVGGIVMREDCSRREAMRRARRRHPDYFERYQNA